MTTALIKPPQLTALLPLVDIVGNSVESPLTRSQYRKALLDFFSWYERFGTQGFSRSTVLAHRAWLEVEGYLPASVNQRLAAIRKLAREATAHGWLETGTASDVLSVPGIKLRGIRTGNWLTRHQASNLINAPSLDTRKGLRDRAILALLVGCALRRGEVVQLQPANIVQREGRWVISDLRGKHGRCRTIPVPSWVKARVDRYTEIRPNDPRNLFIAVNRHDLFCGESLSAQAILDLVIGYGRACGFEVRPHDLRRTCAKLCRAAGGDLEQIQLLLGHSSIQTTERYLGTHQDFVHAPNDLLVL